MKETTIWRKITSSSWFVPGATATSVVLALLSAAIFALLFVPNMPEYQVNIIEQEVEESENFKTSYEEGRLTGEISAHVLMRCLLDEESQEYMDRVNYSNERVFRNLSLENLKRYYKCMAKVLEKDLDLYYHEGTDKYAFTKGYNNGMMLTWAYLQTLSGEVSEEDYRVLYDMEKAIRENFTPGKNYEFQEKVNEILATDTFRDVPVTPNLQAGI